MTWYSMDDMTRAGCTSRRGIRYWEEQGLLGTVDRTNGDTRRYSDAQLDKAKIIAAAQFGSFSLAEVSEMLASYDVDPQIYEALATRLSDQTRAAVRLIENLPQPKAMLDPVTQEYDL